VPRKRRTGNTSTLRRLTKRRRGTTTPSQAAAAAAEPSGLQENNRREDVVDLTCEAAEPPVVDLTNNDSVVCTLCACPSVRGAGSESYVLSSDEEEEATLRSRAVFLSALEANSTARSTPGTISCPICLDSYGEIVDSGRLVVSTKCGHLFCSQCLRDSLSESHTCPTCRKRLTHKQYHPIYI
ncbi:RING finger protein 4-like, partial [Scleropages formosus]